VNQKEIPGRLIVIALVVVASLYFLFGTLRFFAFSLTNPRPREEGPELVSYLAKLDDLRRGAIRFGLDIQGGVDVLMSIDVEELIARDLGRIDRELKREFRAQDAQVRTRLSLANRQLTIALRDPASDQIVRAILEGPDFASQFEPFDASALSTGRNELTLTMKDDVARAKAQDAVDRTVELLRERIDELGLMQPTVVVQGGDKIRIQLPGETNPDRALAQVTRLAKLEFRLVATETYTYRTPDSKIDRERFEDWDTAGRYEILPGSIARQGDDGKMEFTDVEFIVERETQVTGDDVETAAPYMGPNGMWEISLTFNRQGMYRFGQITEENRTRELGIILDGVVRSNPRINEPILNGRASISGNFTRDEALQLSRVINTGALPVKLKSESSQVIGATLGHDSIVASLQALIFGGIIIVGFMLFYYGMAGAVAVAALLINVLCILALIVAGSGTLTLSGIGGVLLTLGMAVDANVIIYERIRDELRAGKKAVDAIVSGFDSAFLSIVDGNLTTLLTALILLQFGQGSVKGFALTMSFGIVATLFTGLYFTRTMFGKFFEKDNKAPVGTFTLFTKPSFNFIGFRRVAYAASAIVIGLGFVSIVLHGGLNLSTEFTGGAKFQVGFTDTKLGTQDIRTGLLRAEPALEPLSIAGVVGADSFLITTKLDEQGPDALDATVAQMTAALEKAYPGAYRIESKDAVGSSVGKAFVGQAFTSVFFACLGILLYVAVRFQFRFGVAAVAALVHDVIITLGVLSVAGVEVSLDVVAALLVVIGYSINDTIIIFDRIRENQKLHMGLPFARLVNLSINESLNRTTITSATTLFAIFCMLAFGGQALFGFALVLFIGIITGTYSSSFIAAPLLLRLAGANPDLAVVPVTRSDAKRAVAAPVAPKPTEPSADDDAEGSDDDGEDEGNDAPAKSDKKKGGSASKSARTKRRLSRR